MAPDEIEKANEMNLATQKYLKSEINSKEYKKKVAKFLDFLSSEKTANNQDTESEETSNKTEPTNKKSEKDPGIAAGLSIVSMFIFATPALGYFYIGKTRKGIVYLIASWGVVFVVLITTFFLGMLLSLISVFGGICAFSLLIIPIIFDLLIVYDVYLEAKGQSKLPSL